MQTADKIALTIEDAVRVGPLPRTSIYQAISDGRLAARKDGRRTFIMKTEFERFLSNSPLATIRLGTAGRRSTNGDGPRTPPASPALARAA